MRAFKLIPFFIVTLLTSIHQPVLAQELNASVEVDRSRIDNTSLNYIDNLGSQIESYLNDHSWTNNNFQEKERINLMVQINLISVTNDYTFDANIVIRAMRPIYNTTRQTTVFLYNDENWTFTYTPNRGFVHDELQFDPITTLLDYYAYTVLGFDFDSFSQLGGSPYFSEAQNLVSLAQTASSAGWQRSAGVPRNRAQLIADLLNPNYEPMRRALYMYHHKGLDLFLDDPETARANILEALEMIQNARRQTTNSLLFNTFFNAKYREIVAVFEDAATETRLEAYNILAEIDPTHLSEYDKLQ